MRLQGWAFPKDKCPYKRKEPAYSTGKRPCEDIARRWLSPRQQDREEASPKATPTYIQ